MKLRIRVFTPSQLEDFRLWKRGVDGQCLQFDEDVYCYQLEKQLSKLSRKVKKLCKPTIKAQLTPCSQGKECECYYTNGKVRICNDMETGDADIAKIDCMSIKSKNQWKYRSREYEGGELVPQGFTTIRGLNQNTIIPKPSKDGIGGASLVHAWLNRHGK